MATTARKLSLIGVFTLLLGGCATAPMTLSEKDSASLTGGKLTVVQYKPDPFLPMTNTKGMFAVVGVAAAVGEGKKLVSEMQLVDPASTIKTALGRSLADHYSMHELAVIPQVKDYESDPKVVSGMANHQGFVLDVRTFGWGTLYYPFKTQYKVNYFAQARLINARQGRLISTERCIIDEKYSPQAPTYDQLMADNGSLLKQKLEQAAQECIRQFTAEMSGATAAIAAK